ncbi:MAG: SMC family ATPase [Clostridiales bacterium]|nr:SMC family ATPase [Clostridiales bacterium]
MRPLKLIMSGFGPYPGTQEIDFEKLGERGLYLITGPTGAGKTSIFDAITFALFGEASGDSRQPSMLRSKYASLDDPTYVELTFMYKDKTYVINRNPEYERTRLRGTGTTTQSPSAVLKHPDGREETGIKDVDNSVQKIIGLTREQFSRVAMISQGDFRKLLQADTKERQEIFRDIFGTSMFETLQDRLKEDSSGIAAQMDKALEHIRRDISQVRCARDSLFSESVKKTDELSFSDAAELIRYIICDDEEESKKAEEALSKIDEDIKKAAVELDRAEKYIKGKNELKQRERENAEKTTALRALEERRKQNSEREPERAEMRKKIAEIELLMPSYTELEGLRNEKSVRQEDKEKTSQAGKAARETQINLSEELVKLKAERRELENVGEEKEKIKSSLAEAERKISLTDQYIKDISSLETAQNNLRSLQRMYREAEEKSTRLSQEYDRVHKAFLDEQAGIMASRLEDGAPCPVCGSVSHPLPACMSDSAPSEAEVKSAKELAETARKEWEKASGEANAAKGNISAKEAELINRGKELTGIYTIPEALAEAREALSKLKEDAKSFAGELKRIDEREKRRASLDTLIPKKERERETSERDANAAEKKESALEASIKSLDERIESIREKLLHRTGEEALKEKGSLSSELARQETEIKKTETSISGFEKELAATETHILRLKEEISGQTETDIDSIREKNAQLQRKKEDREEKYRDIHTRLLINKQALRNIEAESSKLGELEEKYKWLKALSDTANGTLTGKPKVMLETYVQSAYFDRILERANLRLRKLSRGQYDLKRRENPDDMRARSGLELDIIDHVNGTVRSVNTLSGGESFLASLALALGLSDEIAMSTGIKLDTMFVDEGFGSLDSDALTQAYNTLAGLQEGNRLVGVISHVPELKEKIDRQIVVEKTPFGGSTARINL